MKKFLIAIFQIFALLPLLSGQIIPGQDRNVIEKQVGELLWENTPSYPGRGLHLALYRGSLQTQRSPVLIIYIMRKVLFSVFLVSEPAFLRAVYRLQADSNMTQTVITGHTWTFVTEDGIQAYQFSDALAKNQELFQDVKSRHDILRFVPKDKAYAIVHVDYDVVKSLGYGLVLTR
ncbi:MAG: hypothetical protein ACRCVN_04495 [Spirochaetia bacterium]